MLNQDNLDTFWYWIGERHRIYLKKEAGEPKPWSDDLIFQEWKFCNVFRKLDRTSQYLIQHVITPYEELESELLLFNIFAFRAFNLPATYELLVNNLGKPGRYWIDEWDCDQAIDLLRWYVTPQGNKLTSGAYMIRGVEGKAKYQSIPYVLSQIWYDKEILALQMPLLKMRGAYTTINNRNYWGWGPFTIYQVLLDLTYSPLLSHIDLNEWCAFGPGAKRGLQAIWPDLKLSEDNMLAKTKWLLEISCDYIEPHVPALTLQDVEFSLCELSKYLRLKNGGRSKEHYAGQ